MAKKETATSAKAEKREVAVAAEVQEKKATVADPLGDLFEVGTWRKRPRWQCKVCPWDTLKGEGAIREHIVSAHLPPPPKAPVSKILRVNRFGHVIGGE